MSGRFQSRALSLAVAFCGFLYIPVHAQTVPWEFFPDPLSDSVCEVINAANADLVLLRSTGQLVIVTGSDVIIEDALVDIDDNVFFEGLPFGFIDYAVDGDGLRSLWWLSLTGRAVSVDGFTGQPSESELFPADFTDASCDACDFWDDQSICPSDGDTTPPITISLCGVNVPLTLAMSIAGLGVLNLTRRRRCGISPDQHRDGTRPNPVTR